MICPISAKTGMGLEDLLEMIIVSSEVLELKANPNRRGKGTVIEARLDKTKGPIATLLVQNGTLKQGDIIIAGTAVGRVRVMTNDKGRTVKTAGPSQPVEITGLADVPAPGDEFNVVTDERMARELVEQRRQAEKDARAKLTQKVTLDNLFARMQEGEMKELPLIVKADVQGSADAVEGLDLQAEVYLLAHLAVHDQAQALGLERRSGVRVVIAVLCPVPTCLQVTRYLGHVGQDFLPCRFLLGSRSGLGSWLGNCCCSGLLRRCNCICILGIHCRCRHDCTT